MVYQRNPNDRYSSADDEYRRSARLDSELQPDPELAEGPASGGRIAMFAVGIAVILGAVFYGLNNTSISQPGTSPTAQNTAQPTTAQNTAQTSPQAAPPGMRDVTPGAKTTGAKTNSAPGVTTGAAPAHPQTPPSAAPAGPDVNRSGNPPTTVPPSK